MTRSVYITTPIPTLDEVAKDLGINKARKDSIIRIMQADKSSKSRRINKSENFVVAHRERDSGGVAKTASSARKKIKKIA